MRKQRPSRPRSVTVTLWGVLLFGAWNGGRVIALAQQLPVSLTLDVQPDPRLRMAGALFWAGLCGITALFLWQKRPFARLLVPLLFILHAIYQLTLFGTFAQGPLHRSRWLLGALLHGVAILGSAWALNRTAVRRYFRGEAGAP